MKIFLGSMMIFLSVFMGLPQLSSKDSSNDKIPMIIFCALLGIVGISLIIKSVIDSKKLRDELIEISILEFIKSQNGRVTPLDVAIQAKITIRKSEKYLTELQMSGYGRFESDYKLGRIFILGK